MSIILILPLPFSNASNGLRSLVDDVGRDNARFACCLRSSNSCFFSSNNDIYFSRNDVRLLTDVCRKFSKASISSLTS